MTDPADHADSLALTVCRLGLDPASGRLRHRGHLGVAIRGALLIGGAGLFGGKPRPRRELSSVDQLLMPVLREGVSQPETVRAAVRASLRAMRGRGRFPLSSR